MNKDHSRDELSDDTNNSQHSEIDDTEKIYQHNIPQNQKESERDWPDKTSRIRDEGLLEDVKEFQEQWAQVKRRIAFP